MLYLNDFLYGAIFIIRNIGVALIILLTILTFIYVAAKDRLSPSKLGLVACSGIVAIVVLWTLPTILLKVRSEADSVSRIGTVYTNGGYR